MAACASRSQPDLVAPARAREAELGLAPTHNFEREDTGSEIVRCYWTGILEMPGDYAGLRRRKGPCRADPKKFDVFEYRPEAMAHRKTPVTRSLAEAEPKRRDFVIAHEDFHDQADLPQAPPEWEEAAGVLVGLLVAESEDAPEQAERFLEKAKRINRAQQDLQAVFARLDAGEIAREEALDRKDSIFGRLRAECEDAPAGLAFGPCPAVFNNAALAFEATYTRRFPDIHRIYVENGRDPRRTVEALRIRLSCEPSCSP